MKKQKNLKSILIITIAFIFAAMLFLVACTPQVPENGNGNNGNDNGTTPAEEEFFILFDTGLGGSAVEHIITTAGSPIQAPANPTRDGYRFMHWNNGLVTFTFNTMPNRNLTLTAVWQRVFTISFDTGEFGSSVGNFQEAPGETIIFPEAPTREGYVFEHWLLGTAEFTLTTMPSSNLNLTAYWLAANTITFVTGSNATSVAPLSNVAGRLIEAPANPQRAGHHFYRWVIAAGQANAGQIFNFTTMPANNLTLEARWVVATTLPAMFLELSHPTTGAQFNINDVSREFRIRANMTMISDNFSHSFNDIPLEFHGRGNGSWIDVQQYTPGIPPKRGYRIRFDARHSMFGESANRHWTMMSGMNFNDRTMARYKTAMDIARTYLDNIAWTSSANFVDVFFNGEYHGVYVILEHVRVDNARVNLSRQGASHDTVYGGTLQDRDLGFLIEYCSRAGGGGRPGEGAGWNTAGNRTGLEYFRISPAGLDSRFYNFPFSVDYPSASDIGDAEQLRRIAFIQDYVQRVYSAAYTRNFAAFSALADVNSFVDMFIIHELFKNTDVGFSSFNLAKSPGGLLRLDAPWDFDATAGLSRGSSGFTGIYVAGTVLQHSRHTASQLFYELYRTVEFRRLVNARWQYLRVNILNHVHSSLHATYFVAANQVAFGNNLARWQYHNNPSIAQARWVTETNNLRNWLVNRINWLSGVWIVGNYS